ncbi:hypothetical protein [Campylobacter sp. VTCC 70190]|uniref:hypothetical protein n=1 Tax=Campylobacter sp. VTCC 70190 TaxID=3392118 RepID=UPI00398EA545
MKKLRFDEWCLKRGLSSVSYIYDIKRYALRNNIKISLKQDTKGNYVFTKNDLKKLVRSFEKYFKNLSLKELQMKRLKSSGSVNKPSYMEKEILQIKTLLKGL